MPALAGSTNVTIIAPGGTSQHGREDFLCLPASWPTVLQFFIASYLTHALSIWTRPGEMTSERVFASLLSLLFPVLGLARGIDAICRHGSVGRGCFGEGMKTRNDVRKAARSGALGILVRDHRETRDNTDESNRDRFEHNNKKWNAVELCGDLFRQGSTREHPTENRGQVFAIRVEKDEEDETNSEDLRWTREISGLVPAPNGVYRVLELPRTLADCIDLPENTRLVFAQSSSSIVAFFSVLQICYASYQLWQNAGDQFERYGYSAFILTAIPYMVMSLINLIGNLVTPSYPSMYLVETSVMREAKKRQHFFQGSIGEITDANLRGSKATNRAGTQYQNIEDHSRSISSYVVVAPYDCSARRHEQNGSSIEHPGRHGPITRLKICFDGRCKSNHQDFIRVTSGKPSKIYDTPEKHIIKGLVLLFAVATPIAVMVYVGLRYPTPESLVSKVVLPLWLVVGDVFGLYLVSIKVDTMVLVELGLLVKSIVPWMSSLSKKQKEHVSLTKTRVLLDAMFLLIGLAVAGGNFYIVATQILAFGNCRTMPDG